jgi:hypothetical protein
LYCNIKISKNDALGEYDGTEIRKA